MKNIISHVSTDNHLFGRVIWDKLSECVFEKLEVARVKQGKFQSFQKSRR